MAKCITLKKSNCKNCYKCIRHCPVKAISFSGNQAHIIDDECILCGKCFAVCPQNAKEISGETEKVKAMLQSGATVIASLAPSFVANYEGVGIEGMREALTALGFYDVEETAIGATIVKNEYERMLRENKRDVIISSCCHSVNLMIQKYFSASLAFLADTVSPMQAHCLDIKRRYPNAKTVFIGPCVAKKDEAEHYKGITDAVLTFEELSRWLWEKGIDPRRGISPCKNSRARFFPTAGGILKTMSPESDYTYIAIDGIENCMATMREIEAGKIHGCFIEMSACAGSCVGGPVMEKHHRSPVHDYMSVAAFAGDKDFKVTQPDPSDIHKDFKYIDRRSAIPDKATINGILRQMGKYKPAHELNCGSCGYDTCREKAIAIYQGKADVSMCLPFLKDKAESFSDTIVKNTPNGIIVLDEKLEIQEINDAARGIMNILSASDVLGEKVARILDPTVFIRALQGYDVRAQRTYLAPYDRYVEETIVHLSDARLLLCIMRDITDEEIQRQKKEKISRQTVEVADKVVDKQMRIVQEIASLLGETAAETKIALAKLKESITDE